MKTRKLLALLTVMAMTVAACGGADTAEETTAAEGSETTMAEGSDTTMAEGEVTPDFETVTEGTLTVCTDSPYPPMEFEEDGEFTGFDIELMRAIAENLGLELAVVNTGFDPITSGLAMEAGDCDIAAASITITPDRAENIAFTDGYFTGDQSLLALADSGFTALADLDGQSIAVQTGTTGEIYAQENSGAKLISFENPGDLFLALESGQVQGVLQDIVPNADYAAQNDNAVVLETYPTDEEYGFAASLEGTDELIAAINEQLEVVRSDGTYDAIYEEFFPKG